uniref:transposase n=1 Tax=Paracoccus indicus TaxID=2079229 RepID=UPI0013B39DEA
MIKELEAGMATAEVCRRHGLSAATFYKLKAKYGGMDVSDAQRLRALEDENGKLKRLLADAMLDNIVPKDLLGSKPWDATGPRTMARAFIESFNESLRDELLNEEIFDTLDDARRKIALW